MGVKVKPGEVAGAGRTPGLMDHGLLHSHTPLQEIEVAPEVRLGDVLDEQLAVTTQPGRYDRREAGAAPRELLFGNEQVQPPVGNVELDLIAVVNEGQRTPDG